MSRKKLYLERIPYVNNWDDELVIAVKKVIDSLKENQLVGYRQSVDDLNSLDEAKKDIHEAFDTLVNWDDLDVYDVTGEGGDEYAILTTGGATYGNTPNDLYEALHILNNVDDVLDIIKLFAHREFTNDWQTIVCPKCGFTLIGEPPDRHVLCEPCKRQLKESYPDGWSCTGCGKKYRNKFPASITDGTYCEDCNNNH
jgi:hypothetical protein